MKTMIVDDEPIVRKGLIYTTPWEKYGFEIVAEAENGARALERLREGGVEVLITDLTMPTMSGFELMRSVKKEMPDIFIVVLTCHHEFNFAQEALQIGAIDYLVKTQLSERVLEESLQRIADRIAQEKQVQPARESASAAPSEAAAVMYPIDAGMLALPEELRASASELPGGGFLIRGLTPDAADRLLRRLTDQAAAAGWRGMIAEPPGSGEARGDIRPSVARGFFYAADPDPRVIAHLSREELLALRRPAVPDALASIADEWHAFRWIYDDRKLEDWFARAEEAKPDPDWLRALVAASRSVWKHLTRMENQPEGDLRIWASCKASIRAWRAALRNPDVTAEAGTAIYQALTLMRRQATEGLLMEDAARSVGLSRGYFGQCFRPIAGRSYHELLTLLRIESSAVMLADTNELIYAVAEQAGFKDEKYFRTVFKQIMGMNPNEYRILKQKQP